MVVLMTILMKTAWAEGSSIMTGSVSGNAKVDLVALPGRQPRNFWCVFVAFIQLGVWAAGQLIYVILLYSLCGFWIWFPL